MTNAIDYLTFSFWKILKVIVYKRYGFFSVLAAIIRENLNKQPWIDKSEGFAIHLSTWPRLSCQQLIGVKVKSYCNFINMCCYSFSQGWKSFYYTAVYVINKFLIRLLWSCLCLPPCTSEHSATLLLLRFSQVKDTSSKTHNNKTLQN